MKIIALKQDPLDNYFPAILAPTGEYPQPVCPENHIKHFEEFLVSGPINMISIGFAGADRDLMDKFIAKDSVNYKKIHIIGADLKNAVEIAEKFPDKNRKSFDGNFKDLVYAEKSRSKLDELLSI